MRKINGILVLVGSGYADLQGSSVNRSLKTLIWLLLLWILMVLRIADAATPALTDITGAAWYVSPTGNDAASGTQERPFATVQHAQQAAAPGDTVFLRGGTYCMKEEQIARRKGIFAWVIDLNKSGLPGKPITYCAYKDEKPVFDLSQVKPAGLRVTAFHVTGSWLCLKGLDVTGVQVTIKEHTQSICFENRGSHNLYECLTMHDGQAIGIYCDGGSDNLFLNCDAWNNWDYTSENGKGGNVDGFGCHPPRGGTGNVFRGCRAWFNSDDGYDCIRASESVAFENCWAFYNGYGTNFKSLGDGNGFKAGGYGKVPADQLPPAIPRHTVRFCLAVGNRANGFYANHHPGGNDWFNNSACRNGGNFNMLAWDARRQMDIDGHDHKLRNNLSYNSRTLVSHLDVARSDSAGNSFDMDLKLSDRDFASLDEKELLQPRKPNGDLPDIRFLHPVKGGVPPGRGTDVGLPFTGTASSLRDPVKKDIAMKLVASAENSSLDWRAQYGYIEYNVEKNDVENRGYTAGLIGFTSRTHDMLELVLCYQRMAPGNVLEPFLPALRKVDGSSSTNGLGDAFIRAWKAAAGDPKFREAQDHERDRVYFEPAVKLAVADGVNELGQFIYYDAGVMHGAGNSDGSLGGIRKAALGVAKPPVQGGDELAWLNAFLDARKRAMQAEPGHKDTSRVDTMQRVFLSQGNLHLDPPLQFKVYGDSFRIEAESTGKNGR